jgi:hypothetical protein
MLVRVDYDRIHSFLDIYVFAHGLILSGITAYMHKG